MDNLFKNAYFGKPYRTRGETKAIFIRKDKFYQDEMYVLYAREDSDSAYYYKPNGQICLNLEEARKYDIVSEWQESIDEGKLNKFTKEYIAKSDYNNDTEEYHRMSWIEEDAFKAGYRRAKEQI